MRTKKSLQITNRQKGLAKQFLQELQDARGHYKPKSLSKWTWEEKLLFESLASHLIEDFNLLFTPDTFTKVTQWVGEGDPSLGDIQKLMIPVPLFWAVRVSVLEDGIAKAPIPEKISELSRFIQPDHIYLDVTQATLDDLEFVFGQRKLQKEKIKEAKDRIPGGARYYAQYVMSLLQGEKDDTPMDKIVKRENAIGLLEAIGIHYVDGEANPSESQIELAKLKQLKRSIESNIDNLWEAKIGDPPTVSEIQDVMSTAHFRTVRIPSDSGRGRPKKKEGKWQRWLELRDKIGWNGARQEYLAEVGAEYIKTEGDLRGWGVSEQHRLALRNFRDNVPKPKVTV